MAEVEISVIISARNERKYVREAIASVLNQTFKRFEIVFIDDASDDGTAELVESFGDERIRLFRREKAAGLTANLRMACERARGRFLARMDADDLSEPNRLEVLFDLMDGDPELAFAASRARIIDERGAHIGFLGRAVGDGEMRANLLVSNVVVHGSAMIRATALEDVGGYRAEFRLAQDYDLWLRLAEKWRGRVIGDVLYGWRLRGDAVGASRRAEQILFADLARRLACERAANGRELTDVESAAEQVTKHVHPAGFRRLYRHEQLLWAQTLYAGGAYRAAWSVLLALLKLEPASPPVWKFLWDKFARVALAKTRSTEKHLC